MGEPTEIRTASADRAEAARGAGSVQDAGRPARQPDGATRAAQSKRAALRSRVREQRRSPARPRLLFELALIGISYWLYSLVRNAVPEQAVVAQKHASWIWRFEQFLGVDVERAINHGVNSVTWLIVGMNYYYATLHFIVTIGVLVWLYRRHPGRYAAARSVLFVTTAIALVGFYFFPLAPPRLMTDGGFIDTVAIHHTWGSLASGAGAQVSNQYAAMPSMHIGWSLWCGLTIFFLARAPWARALGLLYPLCTLLVIISTANHFWMDAVGGMVCLGVGFTAARLLYHRWVFQLPRYPGGLVAEPPMTVPEQWLVQGRGELREVGRSGPVS
ncbi:inositol phosphorylceramide synthase [Kitasatospora sp. MMS16-BH015]|uniref:phosphatase PAP2 family protein n=1 Tax=Kitasatospora sp. MMS16-BH015 TaxID=2018025 RepID=UPI000CA26F2A|nr:phosphatase PAP2 family protein [Kitasatospora sp. MMS16-BH015]AUG76913.1 inositol phosphorylceramide synthase [Kitasatospora sp. MMS16-BH015]